MDAHSSFEAWHQNHIVLYYTFNDNDSCPESKRPRRVKPSHEGTHFIRAFQQNLRDTSSEFCILHPRFLSPALVLSDKSSRVTTGPWVATKCNGSFCPAGIFAQLGPLSSLSHGGQRCQKCAGIWIVNNKISQRPILNRRSGNRRLLAFTASAF
ncbi:hypothetical protein CEXT_694421 [Caerostris extrusa]|uniref:Uncharacterized protein n=1 Tax=Caerostris extrusa TaxID=172846 RepID=A0AAV4Y254_CAEEX|nr:hypothetical protein CEXT_694421 [Caerostris extrusa]